MRTSEKVLSFLINFLLGVAWAFAIAGAVLGFMKGMHYSLLYAFVYMFLASVPGLFFVVMLEFFYLRIDKFLEMKKQTKILSDILKGMEK
ncbi:MAG: hypothetical protein ACQERK_06190 [Campylobacterota bacterium]